MLVELSDEKWHHGLAVAACGWNFPSLLTTISLTHFDNSEKCLRAYTTYSSVMTLPTRRLVQTHSPDSKWQCGFEVNLV